MSSIVIELQSKAWNKDSNVPELVRMALVVSRKLRIAEFADWCADELRGYEGKEVPPYRILEAEIRAYHPRLGWRGVLFEDPDTQQAAQTAYCSTSIADVQYIVENYTQGSVIEQEVSHSAQLKFRRFDRHGSQLKRVISANQFARVLDAVRGIILDWSLKLEEISVIGDGMTFSNKEMQAAETHGPIHIANFNGVLGDVSAQHVQIGNAASISSMLDKTSLSQSAKDEIQTLLADYQRADSKAKAGIAAKALKWLAENAASLGSVGALIKGWFGG